MSKGHHAEMLDTVQVWSTDLFQNPQWPKSGDRNPSTGCHTISISVKRGPGMKAPGSERHPEGASEDRVVLPAIPYIHTLSTAGTRQQQKRPAPLTQSPTLHRPDLLQSKG